jgi:hypothetical protein
MYVVVERMEEPQFLVAEGFGAGGLDLSDPLVAKIGDAVAPLGFEVIGGDIMQKALRGLFTGIDFKNFAGNDHISEVDIIGVTSTNAGHGDCLL